MFPSMALPQPIAGPIPSCQTITTRSCASSGSALTSASAKEGLKWPGASSSATTICTDRSVTAAVSQIGSTRAIKPVGITALMSSTPPQPCKSSKDSTQRPNINNSTSGATSMTEFRQPLQVQSHLEVPRILVQLGHIQRT